MQRVPVAMVAILCLTLAACGGGGSTSSNNGGGGGGGNGGGTKSFAQFCADINADSQILPALTSMPFLTNQAPQESPFLLSLAATKANDLAAEAAGGPGPGALAQIDIKSTLTSISTELTAAAAKLTNGDTGGYAVNGDLMTHFIAIGTVCRLQFPGPIAT
jgi:hypothetical protein